MGGVRSQYIDSLKGLAIIAVVLYHCGLLTRGYLGVDIFFVINGYFLMNGYLKRREESFRSFCNGLLAKILRLWPLIILITIFVMAVGYFAMLPDDYENLSESVIASNIFLNNVLSAITTKNYWNISNNFRPLMHLWFVGVLLQAQLFLSVFFRVIGRKSKKLLEVGTSTLAIASFILYLLPIFSSAEKFFYFPFRLFEILLGSIIALVIERGAIRQKLNKKYLGAISIPSFVLIITFLTVDMAIPDEIYLIGIVMVATVLLLSIEQMNLPETILLKPLSVVGKASFSIYIVHQPVIAFTRYLFTSNISGAVFVIVLVITAVLSIIAYRMERVSIAWAKDEKIIRYFVICVSFAVLICSFSGVIYLKAGVVRDVPELNVYKETAYRGMHAEYVDIPYQWDRDFTDDKKVHILVIGDSMARDWCNILNESENSTEYEISYIYSSNLDDDKRNRIDDSDYIFYAIITDAVDIENKILKEIMLTKGDKFYVVGIKNFGESNGQIYRKRNNADYFSSSIILGETNNSKYKTYLKQNEAQKNEYGDHYIDMISAIQNKDGTIPVFTDTKKYISADTGHLTKDGAEYYGRILDLSWIK